MDVVKFFKGTAGKNKVTEDRCPSKTMTAYEARRRVEDTLNRAMQTVTKLEKLHQQQFMPSHQWSHSSATFNATSLSEERKSTLEACKKTAYWLSTVDVKIKQSYFHSPSPFSSNQEAIPTPVLAPSNIQRLNATFVPPRLKY